MADWENIFKKEGRHFLTINKDMKEFLRLMKKNDVKRVLDLGCGSGRHTVAMAKEGFEVYGMDISRTGISLTREWLKKEKLDAKLKVASAYETFPYKNDQFDAILCYAVINHGRHEQIKKAIKEMERVLRHGGFLFLVVGSKGTKGGARKVSFIEKNTFVPIDGDEKGVIHYVYSKKRIKEDFKSFEVIRIEKNDFTHYSCVMRKV